MAEKTDIIEESVSVDAFQDEKALKKQMALKEKEELIQKIEAMDESVLPDKDEILRKLKSNYEKEKNTENKAKSTTGNSFLLPVGMFFQFIFTVAGGGMLIAGLIAGFSVKWDTSLNDGIANISIVLVFVGGIMFAIGIALIFILYKAALKRYLSSKMK